MNTMFTLFMQWETKCRQM